MLRSNTHDLLAWYNLLLTRPDILGLSSQALTNLTEPLTPVPGAAPANTSYAQGVLVSPLPANGKRVRLCCMQKRFASHRRT